MQFIKCVQVSVLLWAASIVITSLLASHAVYGQASNTPYGKDKILRALRIANAKSANERKEAIQAIIDSVKENKVDFELTSQVEEELKKEGTTPELLKVIRENYQPVKQRSDEEACREQALISLFPVGKDQALADKVLNLKDKLVDDLHYKNVEGPWDSDPNDNPTVSEIRWFHKEDQKCAGQLKRDLKGMSPSIPANVVKGENPGAPTPPLHTIEIFIKKLP